MAREPLTVDRPETIQAPFWDFEVDWAEASRAIKPFEGIVYVEMAPYEEQIGGIHLPDELKKKRRADVAVVLAVGKDRTEPFLTGSWEKEKPLPIEVGPGDRVLVEPYRGDSFLGFKAGKYQSKGVVRVYGDASPDEWNARGRQIDECIMAIIEDKISPTLEISQSLRPVGRWCLIRRDPQPEATTGGVLLTARERIRAPFGTIVASSRLAQENGRIAGMRVQYKQVCSHPLGIYELELGAEPDPNLAFVPYENITAVL